MSSAGCASIGCTGCISCEPELRAAPPRPAERRRGDHPGIARQHHRPAHLARRQPGRLGDRLDHHPLERALAQLADQQAQQEVLLGLGRPPEQLPQQPQPLARRPLALDRLAACPTPASSSPSVIDGSAAAGSARAVAQRRIADPDPTLPGRPGQQRHRARRLLRRRTARAGRPDARSWPTAHSPRPPAARSRRSRSAAWSWRIAPRSPGPKGELSRPLARRPRLPRLP